MKTEISSSESDPDSDSNIEFDSGEVIYDERTEAQNSAKANPSQNAVCFYILGATLWTTFSSVICALQDLLAGTERPTGFMLLAAVAPAFVIKIVSPILLRNVAYMAKILFVFVFVTTGILATVFSDSELWLKLLGLCLISAGTGAGEVSLLILTVSRYSPNTLCSYIAGSGVGFIAGALIYVGLTTWSNIDPCAALLVAVVWPTIFMLTYALQKNRNDHDIRFKQSSFQLHQRWQQSSDVHFILWRRWPFRSERFYFIWYAAPFFLALFLNCFAEYISIGAILTTVVFSTNEGGEGLAPRADYEHYLMSLYTGEFLGRSIFCILKGLIPSFKSKRVWIVLFTPLSIMIFFAYVAWYRFIYSIWVIFILFIVMGFTVGLVHASCYTAIPRNTPSDHTEMVMSVATISEAAGLLLAGLLSLHIEQYFYWHCQYQSDHTRMAFCLTRSSNMLFWAGKTRWPH